MAYSNGFNGDIVSLKYILQTLEAKQILVPGKTCNPNLSVSVGGESAYFYKRNASSVGVGTIGDKLTYGSSGVTRVDIPLTSAIQIKCVLPHVNFATVSADVVADKVIQETLVAANKLNELALGKLSASTGAVTGTVALTGATVYGAIIDAVKEFKLKNAAKGMKPTAIIVGPSVESYLLKAPEFIRSTIAGDNVVGNGVIGSIAGLMVIEGLDMDETTAKIDFILVNAEAFAAATNINTLYVVDGTAAGYPGGTIIAGEIGHGELIADNDLVLVRKHA